MSWLLVVMEFLKHGPDLSSHAFLRFLKSNDITDKKGALYHPARNGVTEGYVRNIIDKLRAIKCPKHEIHTELYKILISLHISRSDLMIRQANFSEAETYTESHFEWERALRTEKLFLNRKSEIWHCCGSTRKTTHHLNQLRATIGQNIEAPDLPHHTPPVITEVLNRGLAATKSPGSTKAPKRVRKTMLQNEWIVGYPSATKL